jgi:pilus assembly protein CpaE
VRDVGFHQEVLDFLVRDPRVEVVGAATEPDRLLRLAREGRAEAAVLCPVLAREARHPSAAGRLPAVLLVAEEMTVPVLREAIESGADGVFAWPEERDELAEAIARAGARREAPGPRGRVVAVCGSRGGVGATFVATHLAASLADLGVRTALADLDQEFADLTVALGLAPGSGTRTVADLEPVALEVSPSHLADVLYRHPRGFDVLLGPPEGAPPLHPNLLPSCAELLAASHEVVVLHLPRAVGTLTREAVRRADRLVLVVGLDIPSLNGARRLLRALGTEGDLGACWVVVNRAAPAPIGPDDVGRVLGVRPVAVLRSDRAVARAQERGALLPPGGRGVRRDLRALAAMVAEERRASAGGGSRR